ncbi:hypothetical protein M1328_04700 [Patescibacteria group bacterium]|nr:hypothetical protein [Patescibacteria group bacterium]
MINKIEGPFWPTFKKEVYRQGRRQFAEVLDLFHPTLRGFRALSIIAPCDKRITEEHLVHLQRLQALGYASNLIGQVKNALQSTALAAGTNDLSALPAKVLINIDEVSRLSFNLFRLITDPEINEPDWDIKVTDQTMIDKISGQLKLRCDGEGERFFGWGDEEVGWSVENLLTTTNNLSRLEYTVGTKMVIDDQKIWQEKDFSGSVTVDVKSNNQRDIRGKDGLSTDRVRARHRSGLVFEVEEQSLPKKVDGRYVIEFPDNDSLTLPEVYIELAARGIMQSVWHGLDIVEPKKMPELTPEIVNRIFFDSALGTLRKNMFVGKLVDAFLVDPKNTFNKIRKLGLNKTSSILSLLSEEQLDEIESRLPGKEEHFSRLKREPGYSAAKLLGNLINGFFRGDLVYTDLDFIFFYTDLFPIGSTNDPLALISLLRFWPDSLAYPDRRHGRLQENNLKTVRQ